MKHGAKIFAACMMITLCNSCGNKKKNECVEYFDSVKAQVSAHQTSINKITDALKDAPENQDLALLSSILAAEEVNKKTDPYGFKSAGTGFIPSETFIISAEALKNREDVRWTIEDNPELPVYRKDISTMLLQHGEEVRAGKRDCFLGSQVNYLKQDIDDYLKAKHLVVTDCIAYKMPKMASATTYTPGFLIKEVRVMEIASGKMVQQYYITVQSPASLTISDNDFSQIQGVLRESITQKLISKVYRGNTPRNLNHFKAN